MVARRAHNPKVTGSSPVPATRLEKSSEMVTFFVLQPSLTPVYIGIIRNIFNSIHHRIEKIQRLQSGCVPKFIIV